MKKILLAVILSLILCNSTKTSDSKKDTILKEDSILVDLAVYDYGNTIKDETHYCLFISSIHVEDDNLDMNNIDFDLQGIETIGTIDLDLSNKKEYTEDLANSKITPENEARWKVKYYMVNTDMEIDTIKSYYSDLKVKVNYIDQDNNINESNIYQQYAVADLNF